MKPKKEMVMTAYIVRTTVCSLVGGFMTFVGNELARRAWSRLDRHKRSKNNTIGFESE